MLRTRNVFRSCRKLSVLSNGGGMKLFDLSEEVRFALNNNKPVVALESTIITHGMPYPKNVEYATEVEAAVRKQGVVPATIAIIKGRIKVGLNVNELSLLGDVSNSSPIKTSRRDMSYVVSNRLNGGTTVSGTVIVANSVGIPIFATGGLGGVHRHGERTFDISADLTELGKNPVAVVSSGVKSILDIPKTLEYLETQGVFVATFGLSYDFPAFYCRKSGSKSPYKVSTAKQAAQIIKTNRELFLQSGMLFAVPVPDEFALDEQEMISVIDQALAEAERENISGKEVTPFLLNRVVEATKGRSLETNVAFVKNNARVASDIAVELTKISSYFPGQSIGDKQPFIVGGSNLDCCARIRDEDIKTDGRIHFAKFTNVAGGVARNMCEALGRLGCRPTFLSAVGDDQNGHFLRSFLPRESLATVLVLPEHDTAQCTVVLDSKGDSKFLIGDMSIHGQITPEMVVRHEETMKKSPLIILDANLSKTTIETTLKLAEKHNIPVFYEPTDPTVAQKPFETTSWTSIKYITPNLTELKIMADFFEIEPPKPTDRLEQAAYLARHLQEFIPNILVTMGELGLVIARKSKATDPMLGAPETCSHVQIRHYPGRKLENIVNVSGAGDCFASGLITAMLRGYSEERCVSVGFAAAIASLNSHVAVPTNIDEFCLGSWDSPAKFYNL